MKNYIRQIVMNDRDLEDKRVFLENIHTIKGKEFDNVVFDFKLTREKKICFQRKRMKVCCMFSCKENFVVIKKYN